MGPWLFDYYIFLSKLHREPLDIEDLIDGLMAIGIMFAIDARTGGALCPR